MKHFLIVAFTLLYSITICANELAWVDQQVEAIKPARAGISSSRFSTLKNPFIFLEKNKSKKKEKAPLAMKSSITSSSSSSGKTITTKTDKIVKKVKKALTLDAVINKSALISGTWYNKNDEVRSYTLSEIGRTSVTLTKAGDILVLSTKSKNPNFTLRNK